MFIALLIDVLSENVKLENRIQMVNIREDDSLNEFYKILKCDLIDIVGCKIGGKNYDLVVDDEGLFNNRPIISVMSEGQPRLWGNVLVCKHDGRGNEVSLSLMEMLEIVEHIKVTTNNNIVLDVEGWR